MDDQLIARLIDAAHTTLKDRTAELDALDEALGDGDHGSNLARGFAALASRREHLAGEPLGRALERAGGIIEAEAGGAGGRFYGALLTGMGQATPAATPDPTEMAAMLRAGVAAVQARGQAGKGDKTLLDVLIPVARTMESLVAEGRMDALGGRMLAAAAHGLHSTTHMVARHGLAADLGPASVNRLDPGACSCALLIGAVLGVLDRHQQTA